MIKGSLCSGIGALDAATPGELAWYAETNESTAAVMKREHSGAANFGDITTTDWNYRQHHVDLLTSGDPCQSMSAAGRQKASEDERFLWPDVMRAIMALHPLGIFLENVQNLVSVPLLRGADDWRGERGSVLKLRLDDLRAAGYAVRWTVLGACAVGAPHHRHRWFLRARYVGADAPAAVRVGARAICGAPRGGGRILLPTSMGNDAKGPGKTRDTPWDNLPSHVYHYLMPTPAARDGGERGTPSREHALRRIANPERLINLEDAAIALLPTSMADRSGSNIGGAAGRSVSQLLPTPASRDVKGPGTRTTGRGTPQWELPRAVAALPPTPERWGKFADAIALWEQVTGMPAPEPTEAAPKGGRRLNAELSEWMMGYPRGYLTTDMPRNEALRAAGNGVVVLQARAAWDLLKEEK